MSNIRVPVMPEPARIEAVQFCDDGLFFTAEQLAARDAEWLEMYGPVVEALEGLLDDCGFGRIVFDTPASTKARDALSAITKD